MQASLKAAAYAEKNPGIKRSKLVDILKNRYNIGTTTAYRIINSIKNKKPKKAGATKMKKAFSEKEIRKKFDYNHMLKEAVVNIKKGEYYEEQTIREMAGIPTQFFRNFASQEYFEQFKGIARGKVYWGHPDDIERLKNEGIFQ